MITAPSPDSTRQTELAAFEDEWFYRMEWVSKIEAVLHILLEQKGIILNAEGRNDEWYLRILFPDRKSLSRTYDFCQEKSLGVTVERIYELNTERRDRYGLTNIQRETLVAAVERGCFDIPQQMMMDDLATELDISHQALSERLHRGHKTLIENTLITGRIEE